MITPISNNLNAANSLSAIERPRVPRRTNAVNNVSFSGNIGSEKTASGVRGFFTKVFKTVQENIEKLINSKAVRAARNSLKTGFHKSVDFVRNIPKNVGKFFSGIVNKFSKKA